MKCRVGIALVQIAVVFALLMWWPTHRENPKAATALHGPAASANNSSSVSFPARRAQRNQVAPVSNMVSPAGVDRSMKSGASALLSSAFNDKSGMARLSRGAAASGRTAAVRHLTKRDRTPPDDAVLPAPSAEQMEQALALPLAFMRPPAEAGLNDAQAASLAEIAQQFNVSVKASGQDPTDPAYAKAYHDFGNLADEQVWAIAGQEAYMALINQRAQSAGNVIPAQ